MLHLLQLKGYPILKQLQLEEALLRTDERNWCLLNIGSPPAIVLGISGEPQILVNETMLTANPMPLIRRFSGGGTVVVDEETLFVTFIMNRNDVQKACCPKSVLHWTAQFYQPLFPEGHFQVRENDYALGSRKFGGNAQYFRKDRWLHHSTLLWDYCQARMQTLAMPPKMPAYRENRSHDEFLSRICDTHTSKKAFFEQFVEGLSQYFSIKEVELSAVQEIKRRPHRKSTQVI